MSSLAATKRCRTLLCSIAEIARFQERFLCSCEENKVYVTCAAGYGTVDDVRLVESQCQDWLGKGFGHS